MVISDMKTMTTTRRGIANKLDRVGALLAQVTAELREPEPLRFGGTRSTQELVSTIEELTEKIASLEKAAKQPPRLAYKVREVAEMTGINYDRVLKLIHGGKLNAVMAARSYVVTAAELDRYLGLGVTLDQVHVSK